MTRAEFLDWSRTDDFRRRRAAAEQAEKSATDEVLQLEREIGVQSDSPLGLVGSSEGVSAKAFGMAQLADAARQQQAFDAALDKMPPEFRAKYDQAVKRSELAHARTRSFEDLETAKEMAAENPELQQPSPSKPPQQPALQADGEGVAGVGQGEKGSDFSPRLGPGELAEVRKLAGPEGKNLRLVNRADGAPDAIPSRLSPDRMTTAQLRAELEAGGVEVANGTPESELRSGVTELRSLESKLEANIAAAKARIATRQIPRGKGKGRSGATTIPADIIDHVAILANKMALAGVKTFKAAAEMVKAYISNDAPDMAARANLIARRAFGIVRKATEEGGAIDAETIHRLTTKAAHSTGEKAGITEGKRIASGEARAKLDALASRLREMAALERDLRADNAKVVKKRDKREARYVEMIQQAEAALGIKTEKAKDAGFAQGLGEGKKIGVRREKNRQERMSDFRLNIRRWLADEVMGIPLAERGRLINSVANADTMGKLVAGVARVRSVMVNYEARQNLVAVKKATRSNPLGKLDDVARMALIGVDKSKGVKNKGGLFATAQLAYETARDTKNSIADREVALRELLHARDQIDSVLHEYREKDKIRVLDRAASARVQTAIVQAAVRQADPIKESADPRDKKQREPNWWKRQAVKSMDTENFFSLIDGQPDGTGPATKIGYHNLKDAASRRDARVSVLYSQLNDLAKENGFDGFGDFMAQTSGTLGRARQTVVDLPNAIGGRKKITLGEAIKIHALDPDTQGQAAKGRMFNWDNDRMADPFELTGENFRDVREAIPDNVERIIDGSKAIRDTLFPELAQTIKSLKGRTPPKVTLYEPNRINPEKFKMPDDTGPLREVNATLENAGFGIEREPGAMMPLLITDWGTDLLRSIHASATVIELADPIRTARTVLLSPTVGKQLGTADAIRARHGTEAVERIETLLNEVAGLNIDKADGWTRVAKSLSHNVGRALTALSDRAWLRQLGGLAKASGEAGPGVVTRGMARVLKQTLTFNRGQWARMMENSAYLKHRYELSTAALMSGLPAGVTNATSARLATRAIWESLKDGFSWRPSKVWNAAADILGKSLPNLLDHIRIASFFDSIVARALWAGYEATPQGRGNPQWVAEQVERVMRRTQNTSDTIDLSGRALAARHTLAAPFFAFTSDANRSYNMLVRGFSKGQKEGWKAAAAIVANAMWSSAVTGVMGKGLMAAVAGAFGNDKEEEKNLAGAGEDAAWQFAGDIAGIVPFGNAATDFARRAVHGFSAKDTFGNPLTSTLGNAAEAIGHIASGVYKAIVEETPSKREAALKKLHQGLLDAAIAGGTLAGVPGLNQIRRGVKIAGMAE